MSAQHLRTHEVGDGGVVVSYDIISRLKGGPSNEPVFRTAEELEALKKEMEE